MNDIVLLPSFYRPEFLFLCLEHLAAARGGPDKRVWVAQDRHHFDDVNIGQLLPEVREVIKRFTGRFNELRYIERTPHQYRGNCFNFLELYKEAYHDLKAEKVYLVEDDVMVGPDFFEWHQAMMDKENPWVSVGWWCIRDTSGCPKTEDPNAYTTSYRDFSSIGVCWRRETLSDLVKHANNSYYRDPGPYLTGAFPGSPIPRNTWTEQAGLITRLLHQKPGERKVTWAGRSRVAHIGINGYHRKQGHYFRGKLDQKIATLREVAKSTDKLASLNRTVWDDVSALPDPLPWAVEGLYCHFHVPYATGIF